MLYKYTIYSEYGDGYHVYGGDTESLFSEEKIEEEEWKQIVTTAFEKLCETKDYDEPVERLAKIIVDTDSRFTNYTDLIEPVATSRVAETLYGDEMSKVYGDYIESEEDAFGDKLRLRP